MVGDQLDPKFGYLLEAPEKDPDGNSAIVRYSRKTKEQYVMTEVDGKASGWRASYIGGKWVQKIPEKKPRKSAPKKKAAANKEN